MSCTPVQNTINTTTSEVYVSASQDDVLLKSIEEETLESEQQIKTSQQLLETALKFAQGGSSLQSKNFLKRINPCLLYTSPSPRDAESSRMPSSA